MPATCNRFGTSELNESLIPGFARTVETTIRNLHDLRSRRLRRGAPHGYREPALRRPMIGIA
jgi:hypothetical protein